MSPQAPMATINRTYDNRGRVLSETDSGSNQQTAEATDSTGAISISFTEQSKALPAASGSGSVTVSGAEQSYNYQVQCGPGPTYCTETVWDHGTITVTIDGTSYSATYSKVSTPQSITTDLAAAINQGSLATATGGGTVLTITAKATGTASNYSLTAGSYSEDSAYFSHPSFTAEAWSSTLTGGAAASTVYDSGTVSATVNGNTSTVSWGNGSTASGIASALSAALESADGGVLTATPSGGEVLLQSAQAGAGVNWPITTSVTYNSSQFSSSSASVSASGMSGGKNATFGPAVIYSYTIPSSGGYDGAGNLKAVTDSVMGGWSYTYDTLNRLATATAGSGPYGTLAMSWTIDAFGNRTAQNLTGSPSQPVPQSWSAVMSSGNNNRIAHSSPPGADWTYDASGDVTFDGSNSYLYDGAGRLCAVERPGTPPVMTGYLYDGNGNRIAKGGLTSFSCSLASNGFSLTDSYVVGEDGEQLTEFQGSIPVHTNVFAGGKLLATYANSQAYFAFTDWLGTKRAEIGAGCTSTYASLPYGDELTANGNCLDATEHHYTGKEHDQESGNEFFLARYYTSTNGRFLGPDPTGGHMEDPQTLNKYAYTSNSPIDLTDPTGLDSYEACDTEGGNCGMRFIGFNPVDGSVMSANVRLESGSSAAIQIGSDGHGGLMDIKTKQAYTASVNGSGVFFSNNGGKTSSMGIFNPGSPHNEFQDAGWANGGALSGFKFTLINSKLEADQTEAGTFQFKGTQQQAGAALKQAGFFRAWIGTEKGHEYRSEGFYWGFNSAHFIINPDSTLPTSGHMHFGETDPYNIPYGLAIHLSTEAFKK